MNSVDDMTTATATGTPTADDEQHRRVPAVLAYLRS
ncbi:hypothetical protein SAMN05444365_101544 [Micromonospora pattaloongensis]|uniref:Uncharacterized protein n=1 Tax=Micromonospora pattaloongensis TaxID=405436 RepID=A0A1H3GUT9_9ACTN|nr:hypothetical protein SAMN05444365_101544 [Micromonospora pattaloongensis]